MAVNQSINENKNDKLSLRLSISGIHNETTDIILTLNNLAYRAEGNANLVLSLDRRQILRLRKVSSKESHIKEYTDKPVDELTELRLCANYVKAFMQLLSKEFTIQPQITQVQIYDYDAFNSWLVPLRPAERLDKEVRCRYGMLYPDVAYIPDTLLLNKNKEQNVNKRQDTFCIELKPKQGWTFYNCNNDTFSSIDLNGIDKCRYCSMQYLKVQRRVIPKPGDYCPIDLFSGHPSRMRNAINGLIETPQNNFRLFKNGQLIFDDKTEKNLIYSFVADILNESSAELDDLIKLIVEIHTKEFCDVESSGSRNFDFETNASDMRCCESPINYLPKKCILKQILDVQLLLKSNVCSIDEFRKTNSPFLFMNDNLFTKTCAEISNSCAAAENFLEHLSKKERYLLGATALDCSIMLTFQCISNTYTDSLDQNVKLHTVLIGHHKFLVNVTVVDVDPKSSKHFEKYVKETNNSHEAYRQYLKNLSKNE